MSQPSIRRRGLTMVELVLALGLFALLAVALVQLLDTTLSVIDESGRERERLLAETALFDWMLDDFDSLVASEKGDMLAGWRTVDVDGDGIAGREAQILALVRRASPADMLRLGQREVAGEDGQSFRRAGGGEPLVEVLWAWAPRAAAPPAEGQPGLRGDGVLLRGERLVDDPDSQSFFEYDLWSGSALPGGTVDELASGVLYWRVLFATQTSDIEDGWKPGSELAQVARMWDARGARRPDTSRSEWNEQPRILRGEESRTIAEPQLPRRVRIELELENAADFRGRPALATAAAPTDDEIRVNRVERLPVRGTLVLIGEEWIEVLGATGTADNAVSVRRAQRGTRRAALRRGTPIQWGETVVRELPIALARGDWRP